MLKGPIPKPPLDRFFRMVEMKSSFGCWLWRGALLRSGYGYFRVGSRTDGSYRAVLTHRFAYENLKGSIPKGKELDHFRLNPGLRQALCSKACVNPAHLELVTRRENLLRGDTVSARNARKTHCPRGHLLNEKRRCRPCHAMEARASYQRCRAEVRSERSD